MTRSESSFSLTCISMPFRVEEDGHQAHWTVRWPLACKSLGRPPAVATQTREGSTVTSSEGPITMPVLDCRVLGPLEVRVDGRVVGLGGTQRHAVLAVLLNAWGASVS